MADAVLQNTYRIQTHFDAITPKTCRFCKRTFFVASNVGAWECFQLVQSTGLDGQPIIAYVRADHRDDADPDQWTARNDLPIPKLVLDTNEDLFPNLLAESVSTMNHAMANQLGGNNARLAIERNIVVRRYDSKTETTFISYPESRDVLYRRKRMYNTMMQPPRAQFVMLPME